MRIAVNGFGRIGRLLLRAAAGDNELDFVAVNDLTDSKTLAHLFKNDSVHGRIDADVIVDGDHIRFGGDKFKVLSERDPSKLPWKEMGIDLVVESTGAFTSRDKAAMHLEAGAKKVIVSAPCKEADATLAIGVNHTTYNPSEHHVVSNASCTTNCLAPVVKVLHDNWGLKRGLMTTIHAYTNDQRILDLPHKDLRRARAAAMNQIPTTTGAARAIGLVIPELKGRLDGMAVRVPVPDGSLVDLVAELDKPTDKASMDAKFKEAAAGELKGVLEYSEEPLVSSDIIHNPHSSIYDAPMSAVMDGNMVKVLSWYDNEWGFSNRVIDLIRYMKSQG
ncbi:MAG: type I glyceraldehyde-3-phosphate dehydrogenase [Candidatus Eisenbacteria bacterium]|uniref:Glyceraldehyde-3-phosphate dehydrogenase n=1 Tax=Eiseniibacteriota bacterium TaxID=2212470 RepID=A0A7Y2H178_UNCEI|nr:type I glyceraldehyde-3-phosphate dehydrogenase [Candidatus Eisenbacteria bacterium]